MNAGNNVHDGFVLWSGCTGNTVAGNILIGTAVYGLVIGWGSAVTLKVSHAAGSNTLLKVGISQSFRWK